MTLIYHLDSSARVEDSRTRQLSHEFVDKLKEKHKAEVLYRDISQDLPHVTPAYIQAMFTKEEERTNVHKDTLRLSDTLVEELQKADIVVIGAPMYNFTMPGSIKLWADHVARAGKTFKYTDNGPKGLLDDKKTYAVLATGGVPIGSDMDFFSPWLKHFLSFIGLNDVEMITADGTNSNEDKAMQKAKDQMDDLVN